MQGCITWINRPIVWFLSLLENKGLNSVTLKNNTKDTSDWSLRSSVTAGTNRWTFRRGPMHFCSLINPDRLRDRTSHPMCRLVCSAVWENDMERPLMPTHAIRDDSDDWSDCSTLNGNVVYISWHIDYIDMISISILARISIDRPIASFKTSEVNIWGDYLTRSWQSWYWT